MKTAFERHRVFILADRVVSWGVFIILLATYWLTVAPTVSFWDCPEYVTTAVRLVPGHPPGNPVWTLIERVFTMFVPPKYAALAVNMSSGLFTALAGMLLAKCIFIGAVWVLKTRDGIRRRLHALYAAGAAVIGALAFGWCDSTWYSAVEAEVYALSILLTMLSVWLMLKWARAATVSLAWRYLILLAYVFGLSLGVHQLNLLVIPALAIVWALRRGIRSIWKISLIFTLALASVGCILVGMMPSTIALAAELELISTNFLHWPLLTGVAIYILLLGATLILALIVTQRSSNRGALSISIFPALFLSGLFIFADNFLVGAAISLLIAMIIVRLTYFKPHRLNLMMWLLAMLLTGYSAYALIPVRGDIPAPTNASRPGNPFSFAAYQSREQYGAPPLLRGHSPYSQLMMLEEMNPDSSYKYVRYATKQTGRKVEPLLPGAVLPKISGLTPEDSVVNAAAFEKGADAYLVKGYNVKNILTPELDMWLPRLTSRDPADLESYRAWGSMEKEKMIEVPISEAIDSAGKFVPRRDSMGQSAASTALRPTYLQNFQYMATYQIGYMYFRYLLWNFVGRQNDIPSTGEVEHGNFITGYLPLDNAMLQAENALPPHAGEENPGRNRYFMLPLLLGLWGIVWMLRSNWRGRMACAVVAVLFVMTGVAIVVYLNQTPGEPRERDYTFLGSYMAFAMWIGAGALGLSRSIAEWLKHLWERRHGFRLKRMIAAALIGFVPSLGVVALMFEQNYDDHDRSGRRVAQRFARNMLIGLDKNAIVFVDGDNYTFPLWYAQEVEGIRRDVRVINLTYFGNPDYVALTLRAWENAPALESVLKTEDIIYNAHLLDGSESGDGASIDALEMLRMLKENPGRKIKADRVSLRLSSGDSIQIPATTLSRNGTSRTFDFRKLMMLDIIASNASANSSSPRPIYWQKNVSHTHFLGLSPYMTDRMMAYRLGREPEEVTDSALMSTASLLIAPNDTSRVVYMDRTPALMMGRMRADITTAARTLLRHGHLREAERLAISTNLNYQNNPLSFCNVRMGDSVFISQVEFGKLFLELADSTGKEELRKIGEYHLREAAERKKEWSRYKQTLSPSMRLNMSKNP